MDSLLLKQAKKGYTHAYEKLFAIYEQDLYRYAFIQTKNEQDALDIIQEVAYRSFKSIHQLKKTEYFKTWLYRICINATNDLLKKRKQYEPFDETTIASYDVPDFDLELTITTLLNELSLIERQIVYLKYYEDYTFEMIGSITGLKLGTVKTILYRALAKLRRVVKEEFYEY